MSVIEAKMNRYGVDSGGSKARFGENYLTNDVLNTTMSAIIQAISATKATLSDELTSVVDEDADELSR